MRRSLLDIQATEAYLLGTMNAGDRLVFEANQIVSPFVRQNVDDQRMVYRLIKWFARRRQKQNLEQRFCALMCDAEFAGVIQQIFPS